MGFFKWVGDILSDVLSKVMTLVLTFFAIIAIVVIGIKIAFGINIFTVL